MPYEEIIDKNNKITNDFKKIAKECFSSIFETLGKNNFIRWVHTRELSEDVKNLIFDWMSEEEKENHSSWDGFAKKDSPEIKIRSPKSAINTSTHEFYHLITRSSKSFGIYINEGMTEYLKKMTLKENPISYSYDSYVENVHMVEFLHKMLGDSLIKAYLLGKDESFDKKFAEIIAANKDELPKAQEEINDFYNALDKRHEILHSKTKEEKEADKHELDETTKEIKNMIKRIILGKTHQMAQDLEFYKDGKITNLGIVAEWINSIPIGNSFDLEEKYNLLKESIGTIIDDSHLLVGLDKKEANDKKNEILKSSILTERNADGKISNIIFSKKIMEQLYGEGKDVASKIFQKSFENAENVSLMDFVDKTLKIAEHIKPSQRELEALISQYAISIFGEKADVVLIDNIVKSNLGRYQELYDEEKDREKNTIESQYRKIDDNSYIEKRDNQYFYLKIDKNGKIAETEIIGRPYKINEGSKEIDISFKNGLESLQIYGKEDKYKELGVMDSKEFRRIEMINPLLKEMREKIENGNYQIILDDAENPYRVKGVAYTSDIDARSRKINFEELKQDLNKIGQLLQENKEGEILQGIIIDELLDKTFGTVKKQKDGEFVRSENEQKAYDEIKKLILQNDLGNKGIENAITILNNSRKERIENNKKHVMITFMTPEAKEEYFKNKREEEDIEQYKIKFDLEHELSTPGSIPIERYFKSEGDISEELKRKEENVAFGLKGVYLVGLEDDRSRKLLVDNLCNDLTLKTEKITNQKYKEKILGMYIEKILDNVYGISSKYKKENSQIQRSYENISRNIIGNIINGSEIDNKIIESSATFLDEDRQKRAREENKKSNKLIWLKDKTSRVIYEQLTDLSKKLPQRQLDEVTQGLVNAANREYEKGERDGETK